MHARPAATRRQWLGGLVGCAAAVFPRPIIYGAPPPEPIVSTQSYPWRTFAARADQPYDALSDQTLSDVAQSGIQGYEPIVDTPDQLAGLPDRLRHHGLVMPTLYVNSALHDPAVSGNSMASVLAVADVAQSFGTRIIVTNPSPIRWGGDENKSDLQLRHQAGCLNQLGRQLRRRGLILAYHNHDAELRSGGREFHHMLAGTNPKFVKLCFDAHWIYTGCDDSELAVHDALHLYADRVVELHLRQSTGGIWNESFTMTGDIDYHRILATLAKRDIHPALVLEQSIEPGTKVTRTAIANHQRSRSAISQP